MVELIQLINHDNTKDHGFQEQLILQNTTNIIIYEQKQVDESTVNRDGILSMSNFEDLQTQQALIVQDLFSVLLGNEGVYIKYVSSFDKNRTEDLFQGPYFKISKYLDHSFKNMIKKIIKFGELYYCLSNFVKLLDNKFMGKVNQRLASAIAETLHLYINNLNTIYLKYQNMASYNLLLLMNDLKADNLESKLKLFYNVCHIILNESQNKFQNGSNQDKFQDYLKSLKETFYKEDNSLSNSFSTQMNNNQTGGNVGQFFDLNLDGLSCYKGGLIINLIYEEYLKNQGNAQMREILQLLLDDLTEPYIEMLNDWLHYGTLNDPFDEFLIKDNQKELVISNRFLQSGFINMIKSLNYEDNYKYRKNLVYYDLKFKMRLDGLPLQLNSYEIRNKILLTGIYLNILKDCGLILSKNNNEDELRDVFIENLIDLNILNLKIDQLYNSANLKMMDLFFNGYEILKLLKGLFNLFFIRSNYLSLFSLVFQNNKNLISHVSHIDKKSDYLSGFLSDFDYYLKKLNLGDSLIFNYGSFKINKTNIFDEFKNIINEKPMNPNNIFDSKSFYDLKSRINTESLLNGKHNSNFTGVDIDNNDISGFAAGSTIGRTNTSPFDNYLLFLVNFELVLPFPFNLLIEQTEIIKLQLISRFLFVLLFLQQEYDNKINNSYFSNNNRKLLNTFKFQNSQNLQKISFFLNDVITKNIEYLDIESYQNNNLNDDFTKNFEKFNKKISNNLDNILMVSHFTNLKVIKLWEKFVFKNFQLLKVINSDDNADDVQFSGSGIDFEKIKKIQPEIIKLYNALSDIYFKED